MRIGIDCRTILNPDSGESAGVGHYTYFLVKHLLKHDGKNQYVLFFDHRFDDPSEFRQPNVTIRRFAFSQYKKFLPVAYSHMLITGMLLKENLDVFHAPANILPLTYTRKSVITIHDLAIYRNPDWFPSQMFSTKLLVPQSLKHANHIISVSESTKHDLQDIFNVSGKKISVVHEAPFVTPINVKDKNVDVMEKFHLSQPYILYVGTIDARKNLNVLLEAFDALRKQPEMENVQLVIAGGNGHASEYFYEKLAELKLGKAVRTLGYVTHNEKLGLLRKASVFAFPSLYEGFGLPVLEAMQLGIPVVAADTSSMPEICGKAAQLVASDDVRAWTRILGKVLSQPDLAADLSRKGVEQSARFTWDDAAQKTHEVYMKVGRKK